MIMNVRTMHREWKTTLKPVLQGKQLTMENLQTEKWDNFFPFPFKELALTSLRLNRARNTKECFDNANRREKQIKNNKTAIV